MPHHVGQLLHDKKIMSLARNKTNRDLPSSLLTRAAAAKILYVRSSSALTPLHIVCGMACVLLLVHLQAPIIAEQLCATRESEESNGRERQIAHMQITHIITHKHTHAARGMGALNHKTMKNKKSRSVGRPAHTLSLLP
ncbi:hypothetical protein TcCL_Unassigned01647 [Trypanosoma cruzi]|nr:hypothetical protein TcCL_Unassigned01647 [Trypanosoma cruzi]